MTILNQLWLLRRPSRHHGELPQTFEVPLSDTPSAPSRPASPNIFGTVPYPDGVTVSVTVSCERDYRWMSVSSDPEHPDGMFDRFVQHFTPELLATIPIGTYVFTATIMPGQCLILSWPDSDLAEQKVVWLRHRIQGRMHDLARHVASERERSHARLPCGKPRLSVIPGGKEDDS